MTELEHIEIEGFKGLEHVEFEPTDINLITGRNNTGKTSFLEAIDLLFHPKNITKFNQDVGGLINKNSKESQINLKIDGENNSLVLRNSSQEKLAKYFSKLVNSDIKSHMEYFGATSEDFEDIISKSVSETEKVFQEDLNRDDLRKLKSEFFVVEMDSREHVYFAGGDTSNWVLNRVYQGLMEELEEFEGNTEEGAVSQTSLSDWDSPDVVYDPDIGEFVSPVFSGLNLGKKRMYLAEPKNMESLTFIESVNLSNSISSENGGSAVKIDDIGDYIRKANLVDGLKTFTLDYLVFEGKNGDKKEIPYEFMGDGFKSIVGLLWELMDDDVENDIVLLEEPETHMHPGYIREVVYFLIQLAREEDVQLFITTHDSDFINDFFTENLTDEEEAYLEDEFSLLRMEEDSAVVEDYETARENLKDLHLDLRGI